MILFKADCASSTLAGEWQLCDRSAELVCALTQLGEQSRIFNSDDGLICEGGGEFDLLRREGIDARSGSDKNAYQHVVAEERNAE